MTGSTLRVTSPAAVAVLLNPTRRRLLEAFFDEPMGTAQAARKLGLRTNQLFHHVRRFVALGLLAAVRETVVDGHRITQYRVAASAFFFPFAATSEESMAALLLRFTEADTFAEQAVRSLHELAPNWGVLVGRLDEGEEVSLAIVPETAEGRPSEVSLQRLLSREAPAFWGSGDHLELDFQTAKAMQSELANLVRRYRERQSKGQQTYFLTLGLTAVRDGSS